MAFYFPYICFKEKKIMSADRFYAFFWQVFVQKKQATTKTTKLTITTTKTKQI